MPATKVFVSYSHKDKDRVREIAARLRGDGIDAQFDEWEVLAGDNFVEWMSRQIGECELGLIFLSKNSGAWFQEEQWALLYQKVRNGKRFIPVYLDRDPDVPALLGPYSAVDAADYDRLLAAIRGETGRPELGGPKGERRLRITVNRAEERGLKIKHHLDGKPLAEEQTVFLGSEFPYSYRAFLESRLPGSRDRADTHARQDRDRELRRLGEQVGAALFAHGSAEKVTALLDEVVRSGATVHLTIETGESALLSIPWEAARLPDGRTPALETGVHLSRHFAGNEDLEQTPRAGPLKILVGVGAPDEGKTEAAALDLERELQTILDALDEANRGDEEVAQVRILEVCNAETIGEALGEQAYHVLHLSGHGSASGIELENEDGEPVPTSAEELARAIRASGRPAPLVFLAACHTGRGDPETSGVAAELLNRGVPAVLAMQSAVSDVYATQLAGAFYRRLARSEGGWTAPALNDARREVERHFRRQIERGEQPECPVSEFAVPALFMAGAERSLIDRTLPSDALKQPDRIHVFDAVPRLKQDDLIGRRPEVRRTVRRLRGEVDGAGKKGVALIGMGGVGKCSVAGRVMERIIARGWYAAAVSGAWSLEKLCSAVSLSLAGHPSQQVKTIAEELAGQLPDDQRIQRIAALLGQVELLLVLDNFEDLLTSGGEHFNDPATRRVLLGLLQGSTKGRVLITSRYPAPETDPWLLTEHLGPLSAAQVRKLRLRLPSLRAADSERVAWLEKAVGGHPRMLEYVDGILGGGKARLPEVEKKLRENASAAGVDLETVPASDEERLERALKVGAQDILLEELLQLARRERGDDETLRQTAVFRMPVPPRLIACALAGGKEPSDEAVLETRRASQRLTRLSLVMPVTEELSWVHRWSAEALKRLDEDAWKESCRAGAGALRWRPTGQGIDLGNAMEATRLYLAGEAWDSAHDLGWSVIQYLGQNGKAVDLAGFAREVGEALPPDHRGHAPIRGMSTDALVALGFTQEALDTTKSVMDSLEAVTEQAPEDWDALRNLSVSYNKLGELLLGLGQGAEAREFFEKALALRERLARQEPDLADFQRDLSVCYNKLGDLVRGLGQGAEAREFYEKWLAIAERLARQEPDRADFQRDLSVCCNKLGDLLLGLGQGAEARDFFEKSLAIRERLAREEPDRADFQRDLSVCYNKLGDLLLGLGQGAEAREFYEKSLAIAERLARQEPDRADFQRDLSVSYNKLGDLLLGLGQGAEAREFFEKALAIREGLARQEPDRADFQRDLSVSYNKLGDLLLGLGQGTEAREFYEKSLAIDQRLVRQEPDRADFQRDLSVSYNKLGDLLLGLGQGAEAREFYEKSLAIREVLARQEPDRADFQVDVAVSLARIGDRMSLERGLEILLRLKQEGRLQPADEPTIEVLRKLLAALD